MILYVLLLFAPLSLGLKHFIGTPSLWVFTAAVIAIAVLAERIRRATGQLAERVGPAIGGLLTVSFGSIAELVLALFVLASDETAVARRRSPGPSSAPACAVWAWPLSSAVRRENGRLSTPKGPGLLSTLLVLVVIALQLPAVFTYTGHLEGHARLLTRK